MLEKSYITLDEYLSHAEHDRPQLIQPVLSKKVFNYQKDEDKDKLGSIEWARFSWNPITGCRHLCPYCYSRDIANHLYKQGFEPSFHPDRLIAPLNTQVPLAARRDLSYKNVFVCSMADLFGRWVPTEWIEAVIDQMVVNTQWNFLLLTKFPKRLAEFRFPNNCWLGTTVDCQIRVKPAEDAFRRLRDEGSGGVWWLSVEPLIEPLTFTRLDLFDWIVLGGASHSTQTPEWHPPRSWVNALETAAQAAGCKVYEKTNLLARIRQYPGHDSPEPREAPIIFHYLGKQTD